ncbi:WSC domain-containing protein [Thermoascus aurantiacus ATCC 26904]
MKSLAPQTVATVSTLLFAAGLVSAQDLQLKAMTAKGCYKASGSSMLTDQGPYTFQSSGWCQKTCVAKGYPVMALWKGSNCLCGNELPPDSAKTSDSDCNTPCDGWPQDMCGGPNAYSVLLDGMDNDVPTAGSSSSDASATGTSTQEFKPSVITQAGKTIIVTAPGQTDFIQNQHGGTNKAGIAAGVILGVFGVFSVIGGLIFFFKLKRKKEIEDEYRRNAAVNNFIAAGKPMSSSSMSDSRFDGEYMAQRRQSNGSIADDQDFSRRILKVTNPDSN